MVSPMKINFTRRNINFQNYGTRLHTGLQASDWGIVHHKKAISSQVLINPESLGTRVYRTIELTLPQPVTPHIPS